MKRMNSQIYLLRPYQWYKNITIFLPIIFGLEIFNLNSVYYTFLGFIALCLISSANYVINDIVDKNKDRIHPEKRKRPIASGKVKVWKAIIICVLLIIGSTFISISLSYQFFMFIIGIFVLSQLYTFWLKEEAFADILIVSTNFVLRTVSGAYVLVKGINPYIPVSPWLLLCPFFLALFLVVGKRASDLTLLKDSANDHKKVLSIYTPNITKLLMIISTTLLITSYSLYIFFSDFKGLFITLPIVIYSVFRYLFLVESGSRIPRNTHLILKDRRIMVSVIIFIIIMFAVVYMPF